jgi:protoporphyrinogen oxidase
MDKKYDVAIVGAGFTGLAAAYRLSKRGYKVCVVDEAPTAGGLAANFEFNDGVVLERFYHHWFNNDEYVNTLAKELGVENKVIWKKSKTGMYFNTQIWRLSSPTDLLKFKAISLKSRIRLGVSTLWFPLIKNWKKLEDLTIKEWLEPIVGEEAFRVVWNPLIESKFSRFSDQINAVWMWKKLALRGSTRKKTGAEELAYFKGGFGSFADKLVHEIRAHGGEVLFQKKVVGAVTKSSRNKALDCICLNDGGEIKASEYLFTPAFELIASILGPHLDTDERQSFRRINYLGNICLVLRLDRSLSETYWLNVNDPGFPFVGVIEHTNLDAPQSFGGSRIVYISRYLDVADPAWTMSDEEYLAMAKSKLTEMFPDFNQITIEDFAVWRARYAQPIAEVGYSDYLPGHETSISNVLVYNMAQIYPEDRGTNYAIREGQLAADHLSRKLAIR